MILLTVSKKNPTKNVRYLALNCSSLCFEREFSTHHISLAVICPIGDIALRKCTIWQSQFTSGKHCRTDKRRGKAVLTFSVRFMVNLWVQTSSLFVSLQSAQYGSHYAHSLDKCKLGHIRRREIQKKEKKKTWTSYLIQTYREGLRFLLTISLQGFLTAKMIRKLK